MKMTEKKQHKRRKPMTQKKGWFIAFSVVAAVVFAIGAAMTISSNIYEASIQRTVARVVENEIRTGHEEPFVTTFRYYFEGEQYFFQRYTFMEMDRLTLLAVNRSDPYDVWFTDGRSRVPEMVMTAAVFPASFAAACFLMHLIEVRKMTRKKEGI